MRNASPHASRGPREGPTDPSPGIPGHRDPGRSAVEGPRLDPVCAILLAAGESRRMGGIDKLALEIDGMPLLRRTALALLGASLSEILVVAGPAPERTRGLLDGLKVRIVENPDYRTGQMGSVYRGWEALDTPCAGVAMCLADQPLLESADLDRLVLAFREAGRGAVLVPTWRGRRGNPVILDYAHREAILSRGPDLGCRRLTDLFPSALYPFETDNDHCVVDLDTPEDWARLLARLQATHEVPGLPPSEGERPTLNPSARAIAP